MEPRTVVIWEALPFIGGGQQVSLEVAEALRPNCRIRFVVPGAGPLTAELERRNIAYYRLPLGDYSVGTKNLRDSLRFGLRSPSVVMRMALYLRSISADLLYVGGTRALIWSAIIGQLTGIPIIWHVHHAFEDWKAIIATRLAARLRSVREIVCVSDFVRKQYLQLEDKATVVHNG